MPRCEECGECYRHSAFVTFQIARLRSDGDVERLGEPMDNYNKAEDIIAIMKEVPEISVCPFVILAIPNPG